MRSAIALTSFLPLALILAGATEASLLHPSSLNPVKPEVMVEHVVAMTFYRRLKEGPVRPSPGYPLIRTEGPSPRAAFTWFAADGSALMRLREGVFRFQGSPAPHGWLSTTDCFVMDWPTLFCDDGQEVTLSAPDLETVLFGDVTYRRTMPFAMHDAR